MIHFTHPSVVLSTLATHLKSLPLFTFAVLAIMLANDADARTRSKTPATTTTETDGALDTPYSDHGISTKCTWENFQGTWEATPGDATDSSNPIPTQATHFVGDKEGDKEPGHVFNNLDYAVCAGFVTGDVPEGKLTNPDGTPDLFILDAAPYGWGYFYFDITYASSAVLPCVLDPNSGHGNSCGDDPDNTGEGGGKGKKNSGPAVDPASVTCEPNYDSDGITLISGSTLTYKFSCAAGVEVDGFLTLVPLLDDEAGGTVAQLPPVFTHCGQERVDAGQCTILYGGFPLDRKGNLDTNACLEAFPDSNIINGLDTTQYQHLAAGEILLYQEVSNEGSCDLTTSLPTVPGAAVAAYSRYCTSDIDSFTDNVEPNVFIGDPTVDEIHGFDNEFRPCFKRKGSPTYHTGVQDVEKVVLGDVIANGGSLNLNCTTGGNTDSGKYNITITDQATLLVATIDVTDGNAPTLEGISPVSWAINTDEFGVDTLVLSYPSCNELSYNVITDNELTLDDNNTNVTLELIGQTTPTSTSLDRTIKALIEVNVNGLQHVE